MELLYQEKNILGEISLSKAVYTESLGGSFDDLKLIISDSEKLWSHWKPEKGHQVQFKGIQDSGKMYVDSIKMSRGQITLKALPIDNRNKSIKKASYESINIRNLALRIAESLGLNLKTFEVPDYIYRRVDCSSTGIKELSEIALNEGLQVKVHQGNLILYSNQYLEAQNISEVIQMTDFPEFEYDDSSMGDYDGLIVRYGHYYGSAGNLQGRVKEIELLVENDDMARRYAMNLLKYENGRSTIMCIYGEISKGLYPGMLVELIGYGLPDGKYLIEKRISDLVIGQSKIQMRRIHGWNNR